MHASLLTDILIILAASVVVLFICHRLRIPVVVGLLITGMIAGPHGLKLIGATAEVSRVADIGVVLLLFTIGIEMSLRQLLRIKRTVFIGGPLQIVVTGVVVAVIGAWVGNPWPVAIYIGMIASHTSTAITVRSYQELGQSDSPHAHAVVSISIFQDISAVPMLLSIPLLMGTAGAQGDAGLELILYGLGLVVFVFVASRWIVPYVFEAVAATRNRELFLLVVVLICLGVGWLSSAIGLSLALGAFLAGLIVSESDYNYHALGNITPFRDLFLSLFFVSVGMLVDFRIVFDQPLTILLLALGVMVLKALVVIPTGLLLGYPVRSAVLTGIGLSNVGEFGFVLLGAGFAAGLLPEDIYQLLLTVAAVSMAIAPFLIRLAPYLADKAARLPIPRPLGRRRLEQPGEGENLTQHLIIVGFGVNGANLARASQAVSIPYVILEMNPETVKQARAAGERIYYGDATQIEVWRLLNVAEARIVVIAISDPDATRRAVAMVRSLNHDVQIITRTRYLSEIDRLYDLGANEVIPEEFETSVEIFTRVLRYYLIPEAEINQIVHEVRSDNYQIFRAPQAESAVRRIESDLANVHLTTVKIGPEAQVVGRSLADLRLRSDYAVTVLMVKRSEQSHVNPDPHLRFDAGDVVVLVGEDRNLAEVEPLFH